MDGAGTALKDDSLSKPEANPFKLRARRGPPSATPLEGVVDQPGPGGAGKGHAEQPPFLLLRRVQQPRRHRRPLEQWVVSRIFRIFFGGGLRVQAA